MEHYGILSPVLGLQESFPSLFLPDGFSPESDNVQFWQGTIRRAKMRESTLATTLSGDPILAYRWLQLSDGSGYLFCFTESNIYKWDTGTSAWLDWLAGGVSLGGTATQWSTAAFNDKVIATNGVDKVLVGDNSNKFTWLDTASGVEYATGVYLTTADFVIVYENYVFLGNTTENSVKCSKRLRWSDLGDEATWDSGDAGAVDIGGADALVGAGAYQDTLILFKEWSHHRFWLTSGDFIFENTPISEAVGCEALASIINGPDGDLFFYASDKSFRGIRAGLISKPIETQASGFNDDLVCNIQSHYVERYHEVWWAVPDGGAATANDKVLVFHPQSRIWSALDLSVVAFGTRRLTSGYTIDTIPFATIDSIGWETIDSVESGVGFEDDLISDSAGESYLAHYAETDDGSDYTAYFVLASDLAQNRKIIEHKRLLELKLYFAGQVAGDASIYVKRDHESNWQSAGSVSLIDTDEYMSLQLPVNYRAKHFQLKISATNPFIFLGVIFAFMFDGIE